MKYLYQRNNGIITKYENIQDDIYVDIDTGFCVNVDKDSVLLGKVSENIKDLIEVADYVNGYKVISVDYDVENPYIDCIELDLNNNYQYNFISINQIKDIVTKEEFNKRKFEV